MLTYGKALGTLLPTLLFWFFARAFMLPKLEWLWKETNIEESSAWWLLDGAAFLLTWLQPIVGLLGLLVLLCEFRIRNWPRYRATVVGLFTVLVHGLTLLALAWTSVAVLIAAPLMVKKNSAGTKSETRQK